VTRPTQPDLFEVLTAAVVEEIAAQAAAAPFEFTGDVGRMGTLDDVPGWRRFPWEPGFVELDRFGRVKR
jgi:hypothetical protein